MGSAERVESSSIGPVIGEENYVNFRRRFNVMGYSTWLAQYMVAHTLQRVCGIGQSSSVCCIYDTVVRFISLLSLIEAKF